MFCQVVLVVVLATAAFSKLRGRAAFEAFTESLTKFGLPPGWPKAPVGVAVLLAEIAVIGLLVLSPRIGFVLAGCLLIGFSGAIGIAIRRGEHTACRCFGSSGRRVGPEHLVRNGILVAVALAGAIWPVAVSDTAMQILAIALGALVGLLITRWDDLMFIARGTRPSPLSSIRR